MSGERVHLDVQSALLYPASRSRSATRRSMQRRQSPAAAGRPVQEQEQEQAAPPAAARMLSTAASVSARILLSAALLLARASCITHIHAHSHRSAPEDTTRLGRRRNNKAQKDQSRCHEVIVRSWRRCCQRAAIHLQFALLEPE